MKTISFGIAKLMNITQELGQEIERDYENNFQGPFPLRDVRKLRPIDRKNWDSLHAALDMFFMYIAGYASSAARLGRRPRKELADARKNLARSFFEVHDSLAHYGNAITEKFTPNLFKDLATVESLRKQLLVLMDKILADDIPS